CAEFFQIHDRRWLQARLGRRLARIARHHGFRLGTEPGLPGGESIEQEPHEKDHHNHGAADPQPEFGYRANVYVATFWITLFHVRKPLPVAGREPATKDAVSIAGRTPLPRRRRAPEARPRPASAVRNLSARTGTQFACRSAIRLLPPSIFDCA